jgi:hypothetical protein
MKHALFVAVQKPNPSPNDVQAFKDFAEDACQQMTKVTGVTILNGGTFLCPLSDGLRSLVALVSMSTRRGFDYRIFFLHEDSLVTPPLEPQ